jgi:hypothetical protein
MERLVPRTAGTEGRIINRSIDDSKRGRGALLVPASAALVVAACSARPALAPPAPTPEPVAVAGRTRAVTFRCPGADPEPTHYPMTCGMESGVGARWHDVDPPRELPPGVPRPTRGGRLLEPCVHGIRVCGVDTRAPEGSRALACGGNDGRRHGPVEVIAPDGSLLVQGFCVHGDPVGA